MVAQEVYNSKMDYAKATHKLEILSSSLSQGRVKDICGVGNAGYLFVKDKESRYGSTARKKAGAKD